MGRCVLTIAATSQQSTNLVTRLESSAACTHLDNFACTFQPHDFTRTRRWRVEALSLHQVSPVDRGGRNPNQYFMITDFRMINFTPGKGMVFVNNDSFHKVSI